MNPGNLIKNIIEKIKLCFKNWLYKKKKKKQIITNSQKLENINKKKKLYNNAKMIIDDKKNSSIGTIYPKISHNELLLLKRKIANNEIESLKNIEDILNFIDEDIYVNQLYEINNLLNKFDAIHNPPVKDLIVLKNELGQIFDKKLNDYESQIVDKAYKEYDKVDYIIITTLIIDDIIEEINQLEEDFKKNKYTKIQYQQKVDSISEKLKKLEEINNHKEVQEEIKILKNDFYTKKKDKYDLLYNDEIFINIEARCNEILKQVIKKEEAQIEKEKQNQEIKEHQKQKEREEHLIKQKKELEKQEELQQEKENILKRFIDMQIAHRIIILREKMRKKITNVRELIESTLQNYNEFVIGESNVFNFERNKTKTEIVKLYNDITSKLCTIQKKEFVPLEHINIKLDTLTEKTLENQEVLNYVIEKKTNYKISETEHSKSTTAKLRNILNKEREKGKNEDKPKVLKKEYNPRGKDDKKNKK